MSLIACQRATPTTAAILSAQTLKQYPEYRLYFPGATVLSQGGLDAENGPSGYSGASAGAGLGTDATPEEVEAFYARELAALGWRDSMADGITTTAEQRARGWRKGPIAFRIAILRKNDPRNPPAWDSYQTAYTLTLTADDPRNPSWQTQP